MVKAAEYIKLTRPFNATLTAASVALGFWLGQADGGWRRLVLQMGAAVLALSFGNVINDLLDIETDRISHPDRPLPRGTITVRAGWIFTSLLAGGAMLCAAFMPVVHGIATLVPILLLALYAWRFKATPLAGNILVSLLVAYAPLYGALGAPGFTVLLVPAACAFLLNLAREIIKTLQDQPGDRHAGLKTTAELPPAVLRGIMTGITLLYVPLAVMPWFSGHFKMFYLVIVCALCMPLQALWLAYFLSGPTQRNLGRSAGLIKIEMLAGLLALAIDRLLHSVAA